VWPGGDGLPLGMESGGPRCDPGVEDRPVGEIPHVGRPDGWGGAPFVWCGPQQRR
jgi:hypothetical protein